LTKKENDGKLEITLKEVIQMENNFGLADIAVAWEEHYNKA